MKKLLYLLPMAVALLMGACKKSPLTQYDESSTIYFKHARYTNGREPAPFDSITFTFLYTKSDTVTLGIPVSVAGRPHAEDRSFKVVADTGSSAEFGKHLDVASAIIRGNSLNDTLFLKLYRTPDMKTETLLMRLKLVPTDNFQTDMSTRTVNGREIPFHVFRLYLLDGAIKPQRWLDAFLGKFTAKKAQLMTEMYGFNFEVDFNPPNYGPTSDIGFMMSGGGAMHRWLTDMEAAGTPVYEEDGTKMTMGSYFANL